MEPVTFKGSNITFAKNQPEYLPLPAHFDGHIVTSCWRLSFRERIKILLTGVFWFQQMTFGRPLQPQLPSINNPLEDK